MYDAHLKKAGSVTRVSTYSISWYFLGEEQERSDDVPGAVGDEQHAVGCGSLRVSTNIG
jgi:hypothetical protein